MRAFVIAASLGLLATPVADAANLPPIAPSQARSHVGVCMTVEGQASVSADSARFGMNIAMTSGDEGAPFNVYVPNAGAFPDLGSLNGQSIDITGVVLMDRGVATIQLTNPEMLMVAGSDPGHLMTCDND